MIIHKIFWVRLSIGTRIGRSQLSVVYFPLYTLSYWPSLMRCPWKTEINIYRGSEKETWIIYPWSSSRLTTANTRRNHGWSCQVQSILANPVWLYNTSFFKKSWRKTRYLGPIIIPIFSWPCCFHRTTTLHWTWPSLGNSYNWQNRDLNPGPQL